MAITSAVCVSFLADIGNGQHVAANTFKMALYTAAATMDQNTAAYAANNEVANGNGYTTGGANCANYTCAANGTKAVISFNNVVWGNANFEAAGCLIYNASLAGNNAVAVFSFGNNVTGGGGNYTVAMPVANNTTGLIRIGGNAA